MLLTDLRPLYDLPGPWISVYLDASRATERGAEEVGSRWRAARETLIRSGAVPERLDEIEQILSHDQTPGRHGLAVIANAREGTAHVEPLPDPPSATSAELGTLPHVLPLLEQRGEQVSWLRIVVDRTHGEIEQAVGGRLHRIEVHVPEQHPAGEHTPGGGSAPGHRRTEVEESRDRNASDVAAAALRLAEEARADVLIVAGDVRARQSLMNELPRHWRERAVQADWVGGLSIGPERLDEAAQDAVREIAAARLEDALDHYRLQLTHGSAESGLPATVSALQRGVAEAVIVSPSILDGMQVWVGPEPAYLATSESDLLRLGVANPQAVPAGDGLARTAACTGAELFVVEEESDFAEGVGVLLR